MAKIIKYIKSKHLDILSEMFLDLHELHANNKPNYFKHNKLTTIKKLLEPGYLDLEHYLIKEKNIIIGFISFRIYSGQDLTLFKPFKALNIYEIYIKPKFRKNGYASLLCKFAETYALKNNIKTIVSTVHGFNDKSFNMFNKNGFKINSYSLIKEL